MSVDDKNIDDSNYADDDSRKYLLESLSLISLQTKKIFICSVNNQNLLKALERPKKCQETFVKKSKTLFFIETTIYTA